MEQVREFSWRGVTILAKMDEEVEYVTSLARKSRFIVMLVLSFCFISFFYLYANSSKPNVSPINDLKKAWNMGQYNAHRLADRENKKDKNPADVTYAQSSTYRFVRSNDLVVSKGATLRLVIEARDRVGKPTNRGGDMWYATLNSLKPKASTTGKVSDNGDGTYDVTFYAGWEGVARIDVILVHPKEACSFVEKKVWPAEDRVVWVGIFRVKDRPREEHTQTCVLRRNETNWDKKCEYWYPREIGDTMLICGKPEDEQRWKCDDLYALKSLNARIALAATELIDGRGYLFERDNVMQMIDGEPKYIKIEGTDDQQLVPEDLPACQPGLKAPISEGYWLENQWHSLRCRNFQWGVNASNAREVSRCLHGKQVYFLGDTTARQWFETFQESIGLKFFLRDDDAHYRFFRHHPSLNLSVLYQARPLLATSSRVPLEEVQFEVDVLDGLRNPDCNYIIFLSLWTDTTWDRASFTERLNLTKEAIERLFVRCPEARVVVRSPHPVAHGTFQTSAYADNILLLRIKDLMEKTFRDTEVSFLDLWDMNLAFPSPNRRDMPSEVIQQGVNLFMSYVCSTKK